MNHTYVDKQDVLVPVLDHAAYVPEAQLLAPAAGPAADLLGFASATGARLGLAGLL